MAGDEAAYAVNWRRILLVDLLIGVAAGAVGIALVVTGTVFVGALLGALGAVYVVLVGRRFRRWRRLRDDAGL